MAVKLRPAEAHDALRVAEVYLASRRAFLPFAPLAHPEEEVRRWITDQLIPQGGVVVAEAETGIVAMMAVSHDGRYGWLNQLYVEPASVNQGIGSRLLEHALRVLDPPIRLYTFQSNTRACRFYERHGFRPIAFSDGSANEERCPDVLYEFSDE